MKFKNIIMTAIMLSVGSLVSLSANAIYDENQPKNFWKATHVGQTVLNGLDVLVSLEEIPFDQIAEKRREGFKILNANANIGEIVFMPIQAKAYRLSLRATAQPNLGVFFNLDRYGNEGFRSSANNTNDDFKFTITGTEAEILTVNYLRYEAGQIVESGSFELNPLVVLQRH